MPKEYGQKLKEYEEKVLEYLKESNPLNPELLEDLERFRAYLGIDSEHAKEIESRLFGEVDSGVDKKTVKTSTIGDFTLEELLAELKDLPAKLEDSLREKQWRDADRLTLRILILASQKNNTYLFGSSDLSISDVERISCTDLRTVDELWVKYSNGHFGFSVQNEIWQEVEKDETAFCLRVGWKFKKQDRFLWMKSEEEVLIDDATFSLQSPKGHLPWMNVNSYRSVPAFLVSGAALMAKVLDCNIRSNLSEELE